MTCRHSSGDLNCSSNRARYSEPPTTPDKKKFEIEDAEPVGNHIVLKVKYPNCASCEYEGNKVMVFLNATALQVMKWKEIDPHFRGTGPKNDKAAPSPAARFPASDEGWRDAIFYAKSKS